MATGSTKSLLREPPKWQRLSDGKVTTFDINRLKMPGLSRCDPQALKGGEAAENAAALRAVLDGEPSAYADIAKLNAAAALIIAGKRRSARRRGAGGKVDHVPAPPDAALAKLVAVTNG